MSVRKIYVGNFEFDKEELEVLCHSLKLYKNTFKSKSEICEYLLFRFQYLKEEIF